MISASINTIICQRQPGSLRQRLRQLMSAIGLTDGRSAQQQRLFDEITVRYDNLIAGICLSFARSKEDFEDLRQDAYLNIWRGLGRFRAESAISTWIYRVTFNTCVSSQRKSAQTEEVSLRELYDELYCGNDDASTARYIQMYRLIGRLKPIDKSIMLMWLDEKSYDEIADVVGLSRNAVGLRIKRAKDQLAEMYDNSKTE